jgi:drug/metabolite transporter (DMT)-like permease
VCACAQAERGRAGAELRAAPWRRSWLFAVPAAVYALQNNLLLAAVRRLDPPTFLVLSQVKILTTAAFSVALLGRRLHRVRWCAARRGARAGRGRAQGGGVLHSLFSLHAASRRVTRARLTHHHSAPRALRLARGRTSLVLLMIGVALVQHAPDTSAHAHALPSLPAAPGPAAGADTPPSLLLPPPPLAPRSGDDGAPSAAEYSFGVFAVLLMSTCSGFAAVYTECVLKRLRLHTQLCNVFMSAYGALFAAAGALLADGPRLASGGLLQGWTPSVYAVVLISAAGGLLVAFFLRYLDAILKNFASTSAIVLSTAASVPLFGFALSSHFVLGSGVVLAAIALYNEPDVSDPPPLSAPPLGLLTLFMDAAGGCGSGAHGGGMLPTTGGGGAGGGGGGGGGGGPVPSPRRPGGPGHGQARERP